MKLLMKGITKDGRTIQIEITDLQEQLTALFAIFYLHQLIITDITE